ncbi:compound eye opsin BCRH2-like [Oratosquilla oratoria]|uniref:compound eye opsin BCRH2-like n=1 Tax=Oratosquilla oratoria TaxID=337810 RepID=UPI003F773D17
MLVFNLAFSDFGMQVTQFPPYIHNCFHGGVWMFSPFFCELYACLGAIFGLYSLWTLAFISFDRYNVIVNGVSSAPLTKGRAFLYILFCYAYAIGWSLPPFFGWGAYVPEGILDSCSFDYLSRDVNRRSYGLCIFTFDFVIPLTVIVCSYVFIVKAIFAHEKAMREQAKKMNVSTLRSNAEYASRGANPSQNSLGAGNNLLDATQGILDSCSFDYLSCDVNRRSYGLCIFTFDFVIPLTNIVCSYVFIVKAIFAHEKAMREQAKKMNVSTLRSNDSNAQSAEVRIAKVAMTNVALWIICWTPYAAVVIRGLAFDQSGLTPLVSLLPSLLAKTASVYNPMIYAINHPKFRLALQKTLPWFCIREPEDKLTDNQSNATKVEAKE